MGSFPSSPASTALVAVGSSLEVVDYLHTIYLQGTHLACAGSVTMNLLPKQSPDAFDSTALVAPPTAPPSSCNLRTTGGAFARSPQLMCLWLLGREPP